MKPLPDEVQFVCESFRIPSVRLRDSTQRVVHPLPEQPLVRWPLIHAEIQKRRRKEEI